MGTDRTDRKDGHRFCQYCHSFASGPRWSQDGSMSAGNEFSAWLP